MANDIRTLRQQMGLSQRALAKLIGVSHGAISLWERGLSIPEPCYQKAMTKALSVERSELWDEKPPAHNAPRYIMRCPGCGQRVADTKALVAHERAHPECVNWSDRSRRQKSQIGATNAAATIRARRVAVVPGDSRD